MGGAPEEVLTNMYPTVKDNTEIMGFIRECGVGTWHEEQMDAEYKSAHLAPADSCGKQLVFSIRKSAGREDSSQIAAVWIIARTRPGRVQWTRCIISRLLAAITVPRCHQKVPVT